MQIVMVLITDQHTHLCIVKIVQAEGHKVASCLDALYNHG
jgi:hypothetical protein